MAKAVMCAMSTFDKSLFVVTQVYPDGTDMTKVANPPSGSIIVPVSGNYWSVNDTMPAEALCTGIAVIVGSISTIPWTQVKAAIN